MLKGGTYRDRRRGPGGGGTGGAVVGCWGPAQRLAAVTTVLVGWLGAACIGPARTPSAAPKRPDRETPYVADVCQFAAVRPLEARGEGHWFIHPATPGLRWLGRVDCRDPSGPRLLHSTSRVSLRFQGTALDVLVDDVSPGTADKTPHLVVVVDGGEPRVLRSEPGQGRRVMLTSGLPDGEHEVTLALRTEQTVGPLTLRGFELTGTALLPVAPKRRRLEFVGDSVTCGYGADVATTTPDAYHFTAANEDGWNAFAAVAARELDAEQSVVCASGRGMYRAFEGAIRPSVPALWERLTPEQEPLVRWEPSRFVPDAVIVNLGTNDFSPGGVDADAYEHAATAFLTRLRAVYPRAVLIAALGPMLSDDWPPGERAWSMARRRLTAAVEARHAAGDPDVYGLLFTPQRGPLYGEDWHPTRATQQQLAAEVVRELRRHFAW